MNGLFGAIIRRWNLALATAVAAGLCAVASLLFQPVLTALAGERGGIEVATVMVLAVLSVMMWLGAWGNLAESWHWPLAGTLLVLRELDFHDWFFEPGLLQIGLLTGSAPLWQKAIGALTMVIVIVTFGRVAWAGSRALFRGLRAKAGWAWLVVLAFGLAAISTQIDGIARGPTFLGMTPGSEVVRIVGVVEEVIELGFALLLVTALQVWARGRP
jgi:hypothetical protein